MSTIVYAPVPVLNTPGFASCFGGEDGRSIPLDEQGLMRGLETILLPGSSLILKQKISEHIWRIETPSYSGEKLYIDKRLINEKPSIEQPSKLTSQKICETLKELKGTPYLWGGNWPLGIDEMLNLYPPAFAVNFFSLSPKIQNAWLLKGVDCSGLLYYATNGHTPRNTSDLVNYGKTVSLKKEIVQIIEPLDLIVWKGHVIIVIDKETCIESTMENGVHLRSLSERVKEVLKTRKPVNENPSDDSFVIRRWHAKF
ncbi:MAG: hypothetical protein C5B45_00405 [Chlamydiae bacterium]|nr:MAG: hypothetical protein C5B45_00405 [Chlamydiota bacterium]